MTLLRLSVLSLPAEIGRQLAARGDRCHVLYHQAPVRVASRVDLREKHSLIAWDIVLIIKV